MGPYIVCALISCLAAYFEGKTFVNSEGKKIRTINHFFFIIVIFLPCFMAAVRDTSVGTDVRLYGYNMFIDAQNADIRTFITSHRSEPLFNIIAYLFAKSHNLYVYFFSLEFLVVFPVFVSIRKYVEKQYRWIAVFLYFCLLYGFSLNLMRQSIAMGIIIWGTRYIFEKKPLKYISVILICFFIHYSSVIGLLFYPLSALDEYKVSGRKTRSSHILRKYSSLIKFFITIISVFFVAASGEVITGISEMTDGRYDAFSTNITGAFNFDVVHILLVGGIWILYNYLVGRERKNDIIDLLYYIVFLGIIIYQARGVFSQLLRISLYFTNYLIILLPRSLSIIKKNNPKNTQILIFATILIFACFVYYYYVIKNWNGIIPYQSMFLGIN